MSELPSAQADRQRSDQYLIETCRAGDEDAWDSLLNRYERLVYSIPLSYGLSADDAADIAQLTFTILLQSLEKLRADTRLAPWLATVARRHTWRVMARRRREALDPEEDLSDQELANGSANPYEKWELVEWLTYGLNLLQERCRRLLLALYFDPSSPSYAEVAERLDIPVGSIGPTRARCLEYLRQLLSGEREHPGRSLSSQQVSP